MTDSKKTLHLKRDEDNGIESLSRPETRDTNTINSGGVKTIKGPDGKSYIKRDIVEIDSSGLKLAAKQREGYRRYWAIDRDPNDLQRMVDLGYTFVEDSSKVYAGTKASGEEYHQYLMECPMELYEQRHKREMAKIDDRQQQILNPGKGLSTPDGFENKITR